MPVPVPYCGPAAVPDDLWHRWNTDPFLLSGLGLLLLWAVFRPSARQLTAAFGAWCILVLGFVSPLCALSSALFTARVVHHVLLIGLAAPLLVLGGLRWPRGLLAAVPVHAVAVWAWHAPTIYAAALAHDGLYWLMQSSLLLTAIWFWAGALRNHAASLGGVAALVGTMAQMTMLGALITFAPRPLYVPHLATTQAWGLSPLEDQQLAGVVMLVPAGLLYLIPILWMLGSWIHRSGAGAALHPGSGGART
ncbi:cytochrome c oxidase assembly protein [Roseomonas sp. USHLN139]|uniref:cytochrome c oxidase assembly protein n=1 Tax=Roseomonas sp. USHLN139 TaxID=3081298 RepID=UPI003B028951